MPTAIEPPACLQGWTIRQRIPPGKIDRLLVLLHGWKGDEHSMRIFAQHVPDEYAILMPRAPLVEAQGGYAWRTIEPGSWGFPLITDLIPAARGVLNLVEAWTKARQVTLAGIDLAGFSQGAAVGYTLTLLHPQRIRSLAALSGFLPEGAGAYLQPGCLQGKEIFIAHGRQDDLIPVERARLAARVLQENGASVNLCEADVMHKVGRECFPEFERFYSRMI